MKLRHWFLLALMVTPFAVLAKLYPEQMAAWTITVAVYGVVGYAIRGRVV